MVWTLPLSYTAANPTFMNVMLVVLLNLHNLPEDLFLTANQTSLEYGVDKILEITQYNSTSPKQQPINLNQHLSKTVTKNTEQHS